MRPWQTLLLACLVLSCRRSEPPAARESTPAFTCGLHPCDARTSYCEMIKTDVPALPSTYTCKPLPAACAGASSCDCFPKGTRCDYCARLDPAGVPHFQRTCVGGR